MLKGIYPELKKGDIVYIKDDLNLEEKHGDVVAKAPTGKMIVRNVNTYNGLQMFSTHEGYCEEFEFYWGYDATMVDWKKTEKLQSIYNKLWMDNEVNDSNKPTVKVGDIVCIIWSTKENIKYMAEVTGFIHDDFIEVYVFEGFSTFIGFEQIDWRLTELYRKDLSDIIEDIEDTENIEEEKIMDKGL